MFSEASVCQSVLEGEGVVSLVLGSFQVPGPMFLPNPCSLPTPLRPGVEANAANAFLCAKHLQNFTPPS